MFFGERNVTSEGKGGGNENVAVFRAIRRLLGLADTNRMSQAPSPSQ